MTDCLPTERDGANGAWRGCPPAPAIDPASPLLFVINASAGALDLDAKRAVIQAALASHGRKGELLSCNPGNLAQVATAAAVRALERNTAVIAVGGDGSLNTVAQAAHAAGCAMGVIPYGTFNYFARAHGIPTEPSAAARLLLDARPQPVQVGGINDRVFLVNASLGIYPVGSLVRLKSGLLAVVTQQSERALTSPEVKAFIAQKYQGAVLPAF